MKQWDLAEHYSNQTNVQFVIGDVRDKFAIHRVLDGIDFVVHAAYQDCSNG